MTRRVARRLDCTPDWLLALLKRREALLTPRSLAQLDKARKPPPRRAQRSIWDGGFAVKKKTANGGVRRLGNGRSGAAPAVANTGGDTEGLGPFCTKRLGNWTSGLTLAINNIAHAGGAFAWGPAIHSVSNRTTATFWSRHSSHHRAFFNIFRENRKVRSTENIGYITNFKWNP